MLRHQAFACLAFGAVSVNWACWTAGWWHNEVLDKQGRRTEQYEKLKTVNAELRNLEEPYMAQTNVRTVFLGNADDAARSSGVDILPVWNDEVFLSVTPGKGELFLLGQTAARDGSGCGLFLADVTDASFTGTPSPRTITFGFTEGYVISYKGSSAGCTAELSDDKLTVTVPPYGAVMLTAQKE